MAKVTGVSHKSVLSGLEHRLTVTRSQAACRDRSLYIIGGVGTSERSLKINNPDIQTLECALLERMYYCAVGKSEMNPGGFAEAPTPDKLTLTSRLASFRRGILKRLGRPTKISPEMFSQMYRGRKRTIYENAVNEFYLTGVKRQHSVSSSFVKCEKVPPGKAPRCIQPRNPVYNVGVGRYLKHIEHRIYGAIAKMFGEVTVIKGFNVEQVGEIAAEKWYSFSDPVAVGLDAVKFDMHVSEEMLEWEHSIYLALYRYDMTLYKYLWWQRKNRGSGHCEDGKLKYSVDGKRFSGDINTALGNCIIMCAMVYAYAKFKNVKVKLMNNGDDCQVFMERRDLGVFCEGLDEWFLEMGFRMTVEEPAFVLEEVEFCQMRPIYISGTWKMVRNINKAREKDSMSIIPLSTEKMARKWLYAVGECGLALCSGIPIMQSMYRCFMREGIKSNIADSVAMQSGARMLAVGLQSKVKEVTADSRDSVFAAWGFTPDEQVAIEEWYDHLVFDLVPHAVDNLEEIIPSPL